MSEPTLTDAVGVPAVGDPLRDTTIAHAGLAILGPSTPDQLERLLDAAGVAAGDRALDIGCGKGDLLVRLARRGVVGIGVDRNPAFLEAARGLAAAAGVDGYVSFVRGDAHNLEADGIAQGPFDLVACIGATGALGGSVAAPARLAALARPGGWLLIGEGFWRREPTTEELESFGMEPGEMLDHAGALARMTAPGAHLVAAEDAPLDAWDAYEDAYAGSLERWADAHPHDPDRRALSERAALFRTTWTAWRRDAMGFVTALLRVPGR
jgi:cyclopropane fatty-acyl-phospholipid synthase-like methyltransferase